MKIYASIDGDGFVRAFYNEVIHGQKQLVLYDDAGVETGSKPNPDCKIPSDAVAITDDQWHELLENPGLRKLIDGAVVVYDPPLRPPNNADVDIERNRRIDAGFMFDGVFYQSDEGSRENIAGAKSAASDAIALGASSGDFGWQRLLDPNAAETFKWIATDNSLHPMDAQTVVRFGYAAMAHKQDMIFKARALKAMDPIPADFASNDAYWA